MVLTHGFQGVVRFVEESTAGTFPTNPSLLLFSKETQRVAVSKDNNVQSSLDIGNDEVDSFFSASSEYGFEVEFHVYDPTIVESNFLARNSDGTLKSFSFEVIPDQNASTVHYWRGSGWRASTVEWSTSTDAPWTVTITFVGGTWSDPVTSDPGVGTGSRQLSSAISEGLKTFKSGAIDVDSATWAILVNDFSVTFDHVTEANWTTGSADPDASGVTQGIRLIKGSVTISMDDGASDHWTKVSNESDHQINIPFGTTTGDFILQLTKVRFPSMEWELTVDNNQVIGSVPFMTESYSTSTV